MITTTAECYLCFTDPITGTDSNGNPVCNACNDTIPEAWPVSASHVRTGDALPGTNGMPWAVVTAVDVRGPVTILELTADTLWFPLTFRSDATLDVIR